MSFIVILIALLLQFFLKFSSDPYRIQWQDHYSRWITAHFSTLMKKHAVFEILLFILPIVIVTSLIFSITYHLFGHMGYSIFSLLLLWYCMDARDLRQLSLSKNTSAGELLLSTYRTSFALVFWYFIFGPVGLVLYVIVTEWKSIQYMPLLLGIMDWVPVRLLGLSFALVSNFTAVFSEWVKSLHQGVSEYQDHLMNWGNIALKEQAGNTEAMIQLIYRAAIVWLIAMALMTAGVWFG